MTHFREYAAPDSEVVQIYASEDILGNPSAGAPGTPGANDEIIDDGDLD